jgi:hypothetical protein
LYGAIDVPNNIKGEKANTKKNSEREKIGLYGLHE